MGDKYFIPNLPILLKNADKDSKALIKVTGQNIIEINSPEEKQALITSIQNRDFISDKEFKEYLDSALPILSKQIEKLPINLEELKESFRFVFNEIPDEIFEGKDIVSILKNILNFTIKKHEVSFIVFSIQDGSLRYNESYRYPKVYAFFFNMKKLSYDIEVYYAMLCNCYSVLERTFLKEITFGERKIGMQEQNLLNRIFNLSGKNFVEFKFKLERLKSEIQEEKVFIKRTQIPTPEKYNIEEEILLRKIDEVCKDIGIKIEKIENAKKELAEEARKRHGILSWETAKKLLTAIGYLKSLK